MVAIVIGYVVSAVLLRAIYYLLFTPMALWFRICGKDAMQRQLDAGGSSYWQDHPGGRSPASYFRLY